MEEKEEVKKEKNINKLIVLGVIIIIILFIVSFIIPNKKGQIKIKVKSTLEKLVEKSDLETVNITYNVIAKECKNVDKCDKSSNNIDDFKYVVSCKGTITAGIDFSKIKIDVDEKNKKIVVTMPEAAIKGEPTIGSTKFLNGSELGASEVANARKLCQETVKEKSEEDTKLLPMAKEQSKVVLEEYYKQWIKAYDSAYKVEVK